MTVFDNVMCKLSEKNLTVHAAEVGSGIANGTILGWRTGRPYAETLKKLSDFLNCTVDELMKEGD